MCIFTLSTEHPDYQLILADNRDEVLNRPTAAAHWWLESPGVFAPQDLLKPEKGTWIGVNQNGRVAVLVNVHEEAIGGEVAPLSRGALPRLFLESKLAPAEWIKSIRDVHGEKIAMCGGFKLLLVSLNHGKADIALFSNRQPDQYNITGTITLSNNVSSEDVWSKVTIMQKAFQKEILGSDANSVEDAAMALLQRPNGTVTSGEDLRNHVFIPRFQLRGEPYGTMAHTVLLIGKDGEAVYDEENTITGERVRQQFSIENV